MELDLKKLKLRSINETLQNLDRKKNERDFKIINPEGSHALCAGLTENMNINIKGHVGSVSYTHLTLPTNREV